MRVLSLSRLGGPYREIISGNQPRKCAFDGESSRVRQLLCRGCHQRVIAPAYLSLIQDAFSDLHESVEMTLTDLLPQLHPFSQSLTRGPIPHAGTRFDQMGRFLWEPGNTVVSHLVEGSESQKAVVDARTRYLVLPEVEKLAFTPVASLHMTIFQGVIEYRRRLPYWPADIPLETPIKDTTELFLQRLRNFKPCGPFNVHVTHATPNGLRLDGVTQEDKAMLKLWRDRFADYFGFRHPDHNSYKFHITFAYMKERFSDKAMCTWQVALDDLVEEINTRAPVIDLQPPAYCCFEDMNHFEELLIFK